MTAAQASAPTHPASAPFAGKQPFDRALARYCHVLVRADLPIPQQAVQAIHASMACIHEYGGLEADTRLVLLEVPDQARLLEWADKLTARGIDYSLFEEPDHGIGPSALATPPAPLAQRRPLSRLPLWGGRLAPAA